VRGKTLPIDAVLDDVVGALDLHGAVVVVAPPGSGKTTRIPPALLPRWARVLVLQPRRVAARLAARRVAWELDVPLGGRVGYSVRHDRRAGPDTRLEFLTEGLLTRRLLEDPFLEGVGCVVLDEFHERSLHADLALALLREAREARGDLGLVVMSATMDPAPVAAFLGDCPIVRGEGRPFPVEVAWDAQPDDRPLSSRVARAVHQELEAGGDVLVFLPGVRELEDTADALAGTGVPIHLLHGRLPLVDQERALTEGKVQRVVLATNIAETSVTVPGVRAVVDAGLARVPRFDPALGLQRLETVRISRASADQRAGRAGRLGPGRCRRLWTQAEDRRLRPAEEPELVRADLAGTVLQLLAWGAEPQAFRWFEPPPSAHLAQALATLDELGALREDDGLTALGQLLAALPVAPRLGRVVAAGHRGGCLALAATAAALASERDLRPDDDSGSLEVRLDEVARPSRRVNRSAHAQVRATRDQLVRAAERVLGPPQVSGGGSRGLATALMAGFPGRIGRRRSPGDPRALLASGVGVVVPEGVGEWFVAVVITAGRKGVRQVHRVRAAIDLDPDWLSVDRIQETVWDPEAQAARGRIENRVGAIVLSTRTAAAAPDKAAALLLQAARADPARALAPSKEAQELQARIACLRQWRPELGLPDPDWAALLPGLCDGLRSFKDLHARNLCAALQGQLDWSQRQALDTLAPASLTLPSGTSRRLRYVPGESPVLSARIQQCFGWRTSPRVAEGQIPVVIELLAPSQRPVQVTADLKSFWTHTWPQVRKELRGRYPRHPWPEDPWTATPTDRAKPRKR